MPDDPELKPTHPRLMRAIRGWRIFCEQWRHCYLLLVAVFWVVWQLSAMTIPKLDQIRVMGGLHPGEVLLLMDVLKVMWLPPIFASVLYALSFLIKPLNTAEAIAGCALVSCAILAFVLFSAMIRIMS